MAKWLYCSQFDQLLDPFLKYNSCFFLISILRNIYKLTLSKGIFKKDLLKNTAHTYICSQTGKPSFYHIQILFTLMFCLSTRRFSLIFVK